MVFGTFDKNQRSVFPGFEEGGYIFSCVFSIGFVNVIITAYFPFTGTYSPVMRSTSTIPIFLCLIRS
jgi:hypothetical protein